MADFYGWANNILTGGRSDAAKRNADADIQLAKTLQSAGRTGKYGVLAKGMKSPNYLGSSRGFVDKATADWAKQSKEISNLLSSISGGSQAVYAPKLDWNAINAQARRGAQGAVNPWYKKQLQRTLSNFKNLRATRQKEYKMNVEDIQAELNKTLEESDINRTRTTEDVNTNIADVNTSEDQFQTDTGAEFDEARMAIAGDVAEAGLVGSGLGSQKQTQAVNQRNTQEGRQQAEFQQKRDQQQLFKTRTFEDLLRGDELAKGSAGRSKKREKFDLDSYIKQSKYDEGTEKIKLEGERLSRLISEEDRRAALLTRAWIENLRDPAQRDAAYKAYGSRL